MMTFRCVHCQQEINAGATICPFCHFSPLFPGRGPFDGNTVPFNGLDDGPGLFTALRNFFFGDPDVPRRRRVRRDETTGEIILWPANSPNPAQRKICAKCKSPNWCSAKKCSECRRTFVEEYL